MGDVFCLPVGNDDISLAGPYRLDELWYLFLRILVVAVCIDDNVGSQSRQASSPVGMPRPAAIAGVPDDMVHPKLRATSTVSSESRRRSPKSEHHQFRDLAWNGRDG